METNPKINTKMDSLKVVLLTILAIMIAGMIGSGLFMVSQYWFSFYSENIGFMWLIMFLTALIFKLKYNSAIFAANIILASFLVSYFAFGQGFMIMMVALFFERLFRII